LQMFRRAAVRLLPASRYKRVVFLFLAAHERERFCQGHAADRRGGGDFAKQNTTPNP